MSQFKNSTRKFISSTSRESKFHNAFNLNSEFSYEYKPDAQKPITKNLYESGKNFHLKIKVNKSLKGIHNIIEKYSSLKSSNEKLKRVSKAESEHKIRKEEEIDQLNNNIQELSQTNDYLKHLYSIENSRRNEVEAAQKSVSDYCNDLKRKFSNLEKTVITHLILLDR